MSNWPPADPMENNTASTATANAPESARPLGWARSHVPASAWTTGGPETPTIFAAPTAPSRAPAQTEVQSVWRVPETANANKEPLQWQLRLTFFCRIEIDSKNELDFYKDTELEITDIEGSVKTFTANITRSEQGYLFFPRANSSDAPDIVVGNEPIEIKLYTKKKQGPADYFFVGHIPPDLTKLLEATYQLEGFKIFLWFDRAKAIKNNFSLDKNRPIFRLENEIHRPTPLSHSMTENRRNTTMQEQQRMTGKAAYNLPLKQPPSREDLPKAAGPQKNRKPLAPFIGFGTENLLSSLGNQSALNEFPMDESTVEPVEPAARNNVTFNPPYESRNAVDLISPGFPMNAPTNTRPVEPADAQSSRLRSIRFNPTNETERAPPTQPFFAVPASRPPTTPATFIAPQPVFPARTQTRTAAANKVPGESPIKMSLFSRLEFQDEDDLDHLMNLRLEIREPGGSTQTFITNNSRVEQNKRKKNTNLSQSTGGFLYFSKMNSNDLPSITVGDRPIDIRLYVDELGLTYDIFAGRLTPDASFLKGQKEPTLNGWLNSTFQIGIFPYFLWFKRNYFIPDFKLDKSRHIVRVNNEINHGGFTSPQTEASTTARDAPVGESPSFDQDMSGTMYSVDMTSEGDKRMVPEKQPSQQNASSQRSNKAVKYVYATVLPSVSGNSSIDDEYVLRVNGEDGENVLLLVKEAGATGRDFIAINGHRITYNHLNKVKLTLSKDRQPVLKGEVLLDINGGPKGEIMQISEGLNSPILLFFRDQPLSEGENLGAQNINLRNVKEVPKYEHSATKSRRKYKRTSRTEYSLVGAGTYGLVFTPPLPCDAKCPSGATCVGKVVKTKSDFERERKYHTLMDTYCDPLHVYSTRIFGACGSLKDKDLGLLRGVFQASHVNESDMEKYKYQIISAYGGESTLEASNMPFEKFVDKAMYLLYSISYMNEKMTHFDIKLENVLLDPEGKNFLLVDYSVAGSTVDLVHLILKQYVYDRFKVKKSTSDNESLALFYQNTPEVNLFVNVCKYCAHIAEKEFALEVYQGMKENIWIDFLSNWNDSYVATLYAQPQLSGISPVNRVELKVLGTYFDVIFPMVWNMYQYQGKNMLTHTVLNEVVDKNRESFVRLIPENKQDVWGFSMWFLDMISSFDPGSMDINHRTTYEIAKSVIGEHVISQIYPERRATTLRLFQQLRERSDVFYVIATKISQSFTPQNATDLESTRQVEYYKQCITNTEPN